MLTIQQTKQIDELHTQIFGKIFRDLDISLEVKDFFGDTDHFSIADIVIYTEISTLLILTGREIDKDRHARLHKWYTNLMDHEELKKLDNKF